MNEAYSASEKILKETCVYKVFPNPSRRKFHPPGANFFTKWPAMKTSFTISAIWRAILKVGAIIILG